MHILSRCVSESKVERDRRRVRTYLDELAAVVLSVLGLVYVVHVSSFIPGREGGEGEGVAVGHLGPVKLDVSATAS